MEGEEEEEDELVSEEAEKDRAREVVVIGGGAWRLGFRFEFGVTIGWCVLYGLGRRVPNSSRMVCCNACEVKLSQI